MNAVAEFFSMRRMGGQIAALLLVSLAIGQLTTMWIYHASGATRAVYQASRYDARALASVARLLANAEPGAQEAMVLDLLKRTFPTLQLQPTGLDGHAAEPGSYWRDTVQPEMGEGFTVRLVEETFSRLDPITAIVILVPDGRRFLAVIHRGQNALFWPSTSLILAVFAAIGIVLCLMWVARSVSRPLAELAALASGFDPDRMEPTPVPERGPLELRALAQTFNAMLARISLLVRNRTLTLTAIGHDLRTPITRMRLRAEGIGDAALRGALIRDLDTMALVVNGALRVASPGAEAARREPIDLAVLLETICDDFAAAGHRVEYCGPAHLTVTGVSDELWRLFTNLVDNATRYGSRVRVQVEATAGGIVAAIEDDGPGIPEADRAMLLQPFTRGDPSRSGDGMGLGLAIANAIANGHRARLLLGDSPLGGLAARVEFAATPEQTERMSRPAV